MLESFLLGFQGMLAILLVVNLLIRLGKYLCSRGKKNKKEDITLYLSLQEKRKITLNTPINERLRPKIISDIIGQTEPLTMLKAALSGKHPKHIIIYGPPGVGKTTACRLALKLAKESADSPFRPHAPFIELDGATLPFDSRSITNPLMGSVHDPLYQGADKRGKEGIPIPKEGAVSKAHGGILFIDEVGELPMEQLSQLLKVLEDRKVWPQSAYYSKENKHIPPFIHNLFQEGMPADFRLCAATTYPPDSIPKALRSRCVEIHFNHLTKKDIQCIVSQGINQLQLPWETDKSVLVGELISDMAINGREAIEILDMALSLSDMTGAAMDKDIIIKASGKELVMMTKRLSAQVGLIYGLGVLDYQGSIIEVETVATKGSGRIRLTGAILEETIAREGGKLKKYSSVRDMALVAQTVIGKRINIENYDLHCHFPSATPVNGPSIGAALALSMLSAITNQPPNCIAVTGELDIFGNIHPVGGMDIKLDIALQGEFDKIYIPQGHEAYVRNVYEMKEGYSLLEINRKMVFVGHIEEIIEDMWGAKRRGFIA